MNSGYCENPSSELWPCLIPVILLCSDLKRCIKEAPIASLPRYRTRRKDAHPNTQLGPKHDGWPTTNCKGRASSSLQTAQHDLMISFTRTGTGRSEQEPHRGPSSLPLSPPLALIPQFPSARVGRDGHPCGGQPPPVERYHRWACTSAHLFGCAGAVVD
jgi:hypothetical protein